MKTNSQGIIKKLENGNYRRYTENGSSTVLPIPCSCCNKIIFRAKNYNKKYKPFCSELCKVKYIEPKQFEIMNNISDPNFYYLIGLICTDGHISYPGATKSAKTYYCDIKINNKDSQLIYNIKNKFGGFIGSENNQITWHIGCKEFIIYLKDQVGLTNNKSLTLNVDTWFSTLNKKFQDAFIRGVIDGDGSITFQNNVYQANICSGSLEFITMLLNYFNNPDLKITKRKAGYVLNSKNSIFPNVAKNPLYYIYISRTRIIPCLENVYNVNQCDLFMERKYKNYKKIRLLLENNL